MDERDFIAKRQPQWDRLSAILDKASGSNGLRALSRDELRSLGPLYRRAAADLAYARAQGAGDSITAGLNSMVARAYALFYQSDRRQWGGLVRFFTHDFPDTFRRRMGLFLVSLAFLGLGTAVGYYAQSRDSGAIYTLLPPGSMLHDSVKPWETGRVTHRVEDAQSASMSTQLMFNNIRVSILAFAGGILLGGLTAYVLFQNGLILGALAAVVAHARQMGAFWPAILPHGVVELSETVIAGAAGLSLGWAILAPGRYRRRDALVLAARDSVKLIIGGVFLLVFAGLVEGFISHSELPRPLKILFGIGSGVALYSYLLFSGREPADSAAAVREI